MESRKKAILAILALLVVTVGVILLVNAYKTSAGYDPSFFKHVLESGNKFVLFANLLVALVLVAIGFMAYERSKKPAILWISVAFTVIAFQWLLRIADRYVIPGNLVIVPLSDVFELVVLFLLFFALFKRS